MKQSLRIIVIYKLLILLAACGNGTSSDSKIKSKVRTLINQADSATLQTYKTWNYGKRGQADIWVQLNEDEILYSIMYLQKDDTTIISTSKLTKFQNDFAFSIELDTIKFRRYLFKVKNGLVQITAVDTIGRDTTFNKTYLKNRLFPSKDPFMHFGQLNQLKDDLGIIGASYRPRIGDFIQFYLSPQQVLTYLPDTTSINAKYKEFWIKEFKKGEIIQEDWNLRKLDKPHEQG